LQTRGFQLLADFGPLPTEGRFEFHFNDADEARDELFVLQGTGAVRAYSGY
jgi:hypothetical protein